MTRQLLPDLAIGLDPLHRSVCLPLRLSDERAVAVCWCSDRKQPYIGFCLHAGSLASHLSGSGFHSNSIFVSPPVEGRGTAEREYRLDERLRGC